MWDAWDVDEFYRNTVTDLTDADEVTPGEGGASVRIVRSFGASRVTQVVSLPPGERRLVLDTAVDWHETEEFLKLAFPLDVHAERYASEAQSGHFHRPTHTNTSWEAAKFEVCNHPFRHALVAGAAIGNAVREGRIDGVAEVAPLVTVDHEAVVVTAVKPADDGSGDVVVRFHEAHGCCAPSSW